MECISFGLCVDKNWLDILEHNKDKIIGDVTWSSTWLLFAQLQTWVAWYDMKLLILFSLFFFFQETLKIIQPIFLGKIINYFENYDSSDEVDLNFAYCYAAALSVCTLILAIMHHLYFYHVQRAGMKLRVAMCHMIYRKVSKPVHRYIWHLTAISLEELKNTVFCYIHACNSIEVTHL